MDLKEAKELLKEMQENCKSKTIYKDEKAEAKAEAIEVVLKELDEKDELLHNTVEYNAVKQKEWILKDIKKERVIDEMAKDIDLIDKGKLHINDYYDGVEDIIDYYNERIKE